MYLIFYLLIPFIFSKNDYYLTNWKYLDIYRTKFEGILEYKNNNEFNAKDYNIIFQNESSLFPIKKLKINIDLECNEIIHLKLTDYEKERWNPSDYTISPNYKNKIKKCKNIIPLKTNGIIINEDKKEPFSFKIIKNQETILTTEKANLLFSDYFLTLGMYLTSNDIYGFGERYHDFKLGDGIFTTWPNDTGGIYEDLGTGGFNLMSHQPLGFHKTSNGKFLGILFNNINAQDLYINSTIIENLTYFEHRTIGGMIEYYFYYGNTPDDVILKLHEIIGRPIIPPFWSFGYHQCRWGYSHEGQFEEVFKRLKKYEIPFDTLWIDLDLMENNRIFSYNKRRFQNFPKILEKIHEEKYYFVPLIDIGFPINNSDPYYKLGHKKNAFIMSNYTKNELISLVWPGKAVFPDFFIKESIEVWHYAMSLYYNDIKYDGIWIDMNEPAMLESLINMRGEFLEFNDNKDKPTDNFNPIFNEFEYIPYIPGYNPPFRCDIRSHSISENAYSNLLNENPFLYTYNMKPLLGLLQGKYTYEGLEKIKKRPFIISRETTIGSNQYNFHWLGDNHSNYKDMKQSLNGIFNFQIFGIPMTGDDICGFFYDTNDSLCSRWYSLGSLYPFSRNHKIFEAIRQEPYAFYERNFSNNRTLNMAKYALRIKYSLLRFYYSEMFKISIGKIGSFFKPVFFNFPNDKETYNNIDSSLMLGNTFIFFPIFQDEENNIHVYFPNEDWNYLNGSILLNKTINNNDGKKKNLTAKFDDHHLYIKGGVIFTQQDTFNIPVKNTNDLRGRRLEIIVNPDSMNHKAKGELFFDNDDDLNPIKSQDYYDILIHFSYDILTFRKINRMNSGYQYNDDILSYIKFYRMDYFPNQNTLFLTIITLDKKYLVKLENYEENKLKADLTKFNISIFDIKSAKIDNKDNDNLYEINNIFNKL